MSRFELSGARVLVTGAGSGIGEAAALRFAALGAEVLAVDINDESAEATARRCREAGARGADSRVCDVADSNAVKALAADIGDVDVLVNNAGVGIAGSLLDTSIEDWDWLISINLDGVAYGCYAFGPGMLARGRGQIVNIASAAAYVPNRNMAAYCAAKAGVLHFSQCLRADWASGGVGVTAICPGVINTSIPANTRMYGVTEERRQQLIRAFRFGHSPDLVAKAIVRAVERNQAVVPVGLESSVAYRALRFAPGPVQGLVAKLQMR
jgi:short-subunit dehydrogenase